jgi:hypothetical protein
MYIQISRCHTLWRKVYITGFLGVVLVASIGKAHIYPCSRSNCTLNTQTTSPIRPAFHPSRAPTPGPGPAGLVQVQLLSALCLSGYLAQHPHHTYPFLPPY